MRCGRSHRVAGRRMVVVVRGGSRAGDRRTPWRLRTGVGPRAGICPSATRRVPEALRAAPPVRIARPVGADAPMPREAEVAADRLRPSNTRSPPRLFAGAAIVETPVSQVMADSATRVGIEAVVLCLFRPLTPPLPGGPHRTRQVHPAWGSGNRRPCPEDAYTGPGPRVRWGGIRPRPAPRRPPP